MKVNDILPLTPTYDIIEVRDMTGELLEEVYNPKKDERVSDFGEYKIEQISSKSSSRIIIFIEI